MKIAKIAKVAKVAKVAKKGTLVFIASLALLCSCSTSVTVEGSLPTPLVKRIPASVGVYFSPEFESFRHEEVIAQVGSFKVDFGQQNLNFFSNLLAAMFNSVTLVDEPPVPPEQMAGLDGVLVPEIVKFGFLTPGISGLNFYSASIHYRLTLFGRDGSKLADWTVVGYGKAEATAFGNDEALKQATLLAIRDGGARIALEMPAEPAFAAWIAAQGAPEAR